MSDMIPAVFTSGVFRPLEPVDLAEGTHAEVIPLSSPESSPRKALSEWPSDYFALTAGALADEEFDRPSQGELPKREDW